MCTYSVTDRAAQSLDSDSITTIKPLVDICKSSILHGQITIHLDLVHIYQDGLRYSTCPQSEPDHEAPRPAISISQPLRVEQVVVKKLQKGEFNMTALLASGLT